MNIEERFNRLVRMGDFCLELAVRGGHTIEQQVKEGNGSESEQRTLAALVSAAGQAYSAAVALQTVAEKDWKQGGT